MHQQSVVVVGGGIGGIVAATFCARAGLTTTLFEGASQLGGRARSDQVDGFAFDRGARAYYPGGAGERVLAELDVQLPTRVAPTDGSVVVCGDELHPLPDTLRAFANASWLGVSGRASLARFVVRLGTERWPDGRTAEEWVSAVEDGPARQVVRALVRIAAYSGELGRIDAGIVARQLLGSARNGARYVEGGWQTLIAALSDRARAAGVQIVTGAAARAVAPGGVRTDRGDHEAGHVVLAVPPDRAAALLGAPLPAHPGPASVGALQIALRREVLAGGPRRIVLSDDPPVFVSDFSAVVPLGPDGVHVVHAVHYGEPSRADVDRVLDRAWPRWREGVVAERWLPHMVAAASVPEPGRPRLPIDGVPGIWLAGDGYGPEGHLADVAFASGRAVADAIVGRVACSAA